MLNENVTTMDSPFIRKHPCIYLKTHNTASYNWEVISDFYSPLDTVFYKFYFFQCLFHLWLAEGINSIEHFINSLNIPEKSYYN